MVSESWPSGRQIVQGTIALSQKEQLNILEVLLAFVTGDSSTDVFLITVQSG